MHHARSNPVEITTRRARSRDADAVVRIAVAAYETTAWLAPLPPLTAAEVQAFIAQRGNAAFIASCDGRDVGTISSAREGVVTQLFRLGVVEPYRRRGIGERLVREVEETARAEGAAVVYLQTYRELGLIDYYERLGYHMDGEQTDPFQSTGLVRIDMLKVF
ncbi:MAG TPA: GNAT family N-acetyltransferase [Candidatus Eremiobacteraceae bacterium]|nr:GNAT family N-acetyltransferase [Candidatus Eremiobacteraceae bacterium]